MYSSYHLTLHLHFLSFCSYVLLHVWIFQFNFQPINLLYSVYYAIIASLLKCSFLFCFYPKSCRKYIFIDEMLFQIFLTIYLFQVFLLTLLTLLGGVHSSFCYCLASVLLTFLKRLVLLGCLWLWFWESPSMCLLYFYNLHPMYGVSIWNGSLFSKSENSQHCQKLVSTWPLQDFPTLVLFLSQLLKPT